MFQNRKLLLLRFENYYDTELNYQAEHFITTKRDKEFHGYGLKSIRYTVNKYDGAVSIDTKENWFDSKIRYRSVKMHKNRLTKSYNIYKCIAIF